MRRRVLYFKKDTGTIIQGIGGTSTAYIAEGAACSAEGISGGGFVGRMELVDNMIEIRKVDEHGKPYRNFGKVDVRGKKIQLDVDGVMVPVNKTNGLLFVDEPDPIDKPAQPVQQGQQQRR